MPEQQITGFPVRAAPNSRVTKDSENFELLAVNATFDGTSAAADFLPAVEVVSDSGDVVARHVTGETVAAGGSAEVTFAPFLRGATAAASTPTGTELAYAQRTTPLSLDGTLRVFVTAPSVTLDGATRIQVTWYALNLQSGNVAFQASNAFLFDGTSAIGLLAQVTTQGDAVGNYTVVTASRFLTPSAGNHTYSIRAQTTAPAGGGVIRAGAGGGGFDMPSFLRVTTA